MHKTTFMTFRLLLFLLTGLTVWGAASLQKHIDITHLAVPGFFAKHTTVTKDDVFDDQFFQFNINVHTNPTNDTLRKIGQPNPAQPVSSRQTVLTQHLIQARYYPAFAELQKELDSRLAELKKAAWLDYHNFKQTGSPSIPEMVSKYTTVGLRLQAAVDDAFYKNLEQMKKELRAAGLPLDLANRAEMEYKTQINRKKTELIRKGKSKI